MASPRTHRSLRSLGRTSLAVLAFGAVSVAAATQDADGNVIILSDDSGRQASIGAMADIRESLSPAPLDGQQIVDEFKRLCLDTAMNPEAHAAAAAASSWGFSRRETVLPAQGNRAAFSLTEFRSPSAITSMWVGENGDALRGRPFATRDRGATVTGPVDPRDLYAPQCNLSLKATGLTDAAPLAAALESAIGAPGVRVVVRPGFADGNWVVQDPSGSRRRIFFQVADVRRPEQLVHLTVQILPQERR